MMNNIGIAAKRAALDLSNVSSEIKNKALESAAGKIRENSDLIMEKNIVDLTSAKQRRLPSATIDRLELTVERIQSMASGIESVAELGDPVGRILKEWERPNGLQ